MSWPRDDAKLERVRALLDEQSLDALVVRAPDNVLYLTNFWGMKGYDACVFPRDGEPRLICLEASAEDAARTAWTEMFATCAGTTSGTRGRRSPARSSWRSRPPRGYGRVGLELSLGHAGIGPDGRRADDLHEGVVRRLSECGRRDAAAGPARSVKTEQEVARIRIANAIAADAMEHVRARLEWA